MTKQASLSRRQLMKYGAGAVGAATLAFSFGSRAAGAVGPRSPTHAGSSTLLAPQGVAIVAAIAAKIRHEMCLGMGTTGRPRAGSAATAALSYLASRSSTRSQAGRANAKALLGASVATRKSVFGTYYDADKKAHDPGAPILDATANHAIDQIRRKRGHMFTPAPKKPKPKLKFKRYNAGDWNVNKVKCLAGTSGESGSDEILMAGTLVAPNGKTGKISQWKVHDDFDPGEQKNYDYSPCVGIGGGSANPIIQLACPNGSPDDIHHGRKVASFSMEGSGPKASLLTLVMAEEDPGGGFNKLVEELYASVKKEVDAYIEDNVKELIASMLDGEWYEALAAIIVYVVVELVDWIVGLIDNPDDPIAACSWIAETPNSLQPTVESLFGGQHLAAPAGVWALPKQSKEYKGDGGRFVVDVHWRARSLT